MSKYVSLLHEKQPLQLTIHWICISVTYIVFINVHIIYLIFSFQGKMANSVVMMTLKVMKILPVIQTFCPCPVSHIPKIRVQSLKT